jgi:putative endonuclease
MKSYYVYILTNKHNNVLYTGVTNNLTRRVYEHRQKLVPGFTQKYNSTKLVYFEETNDVLSAIAREKQLKKWRREWKKNLITGFNPNLDDLAVKLNLLDDNSKE